MPNIDSVRPSDSRNINRTNEIKSEAKVLKQESPTHSNASHRTHESVEARISRWFAQAGISSSRFTKVDPEPNKKLERREFIKRQKRLENLENILERALDFNVDADSPDSIDVDWFFSFVELAEHVYSPAMQDLWGKIFAMEIGRPGSFSIRTLKTLKELTQRDANIFQAAISLSARKKGEYSPKILYGYYQKPSFWAVFTLNKHHQINLAEFGLAYPDLLSLMDAGLIYNSEIESGEIGINNKSEWKINQETLHIAPKHSGLFLNYYKFTPTGAELGKLVKVLPNSQYVQSIKQLLSHDFELS